MQNGNGVSADMMSAQDAAAFLGVSVRQFRRLRAQERLQGKLVDGELRFVRHAVEALADDPGDDDGELGHVERVLALAIKAVQQQSEAAAAQTESTRKLLEQMSEALAKSQKDAIEGVGILREKILDDAKVEAEKLRDATNERLKEKAITALLPLAPSLVGAAAQKMGVSLGKAPAMQSALLVAARLSETTMTTLQRKLSPEGWATVLTAHLYAKSMQMDPNELVAEVEKLSVEDRAALVTSLDPHDAMALNALLEGKVST